MNVKIKKLSNEVVTPSYAKFGDAGMDLTAISSRVTDDFIEYQTGLAIEIPVGFMGLIFPRSSISKYDLALANSVGVIDSGYRGEILCRFKTTANPVSKVYVRGDKVAQLVIVPCLSVELEEVDSLSDTDRGQGGFGHTGK